MKTGIAVAAVLLLVAGLTSGSIFVSSFTNHDSSMITVSGTLELGVEAGCMVLRADNGMEYLLLGWSDYPPVGSGVAVTGQVDDMVASYCMQGNAAIRVVSISALDAATSQSISYGTFTAGTATVITGSTLQPTTVTGERLTISGYAYQAIETPQCRPQCGAPSLILTYLYVPAGTGCTGFMGCFPPPRYYRLRNMDGNEFQTTAPNGTYATVTGISVTPSSWNCESFYAPKICMTDDIYVESIAFGASSYSLSSSFTISTSEPSSRRVPITGFPQNLPSTSVSGSQEAASSTE